MQESIEASIVRIYSADGRIVGTGFLVGERHILTCAHVISKALALADSLVDPPPGVVSLDFPRLSPRTLQTANIVLWCPPSADGSGDLTGLELEQEPPIGAERVRFASAENVWKHDFGILGFPEGYDDGVWTTGRLLRRQATNWIQIEDIKAQGFAVGPGFSGAPVWDEQLQGVVGMVVAASRPADTRTAFVIPSDVLATAWPLLTVPPGKPRNPYKGLRPFTQHDATDFFGREAVVEKVVDLVNSVITEHSASSSIRMLSILGPSGVGKSSLVMAGLLPKLQQGAIPGSKEWVYLDPIVTGKRPLEALTSILKPHFPDTSFKTLREDLEDETARGLHLFASQLAKQRGTRVVLLIDQCEELFTQTETENERQHFIHLLLNACSEPRGALLVLLTMRADFYDRSMQYPELFHLIDTQHLALLAIEPDDLRRVVEQPAALPDVQITFEGDLVNRLLFEVQGQPGALPLLQFTLDQLFKLRSGRQLTLSAYRELGGVKGALTKKAEETYADLPSDEHHKLARSLFIRLIDPGETEQDTTRRRAALSEFSLAEASQTRLLQEVADAFIAARLLTTNEIAGTTTIEVSHEALIREWPRLAGWLREARDDIRLQHAISEDVAEWERRNKSKDRVYRGSQLTEAIAWSKRNLLSEKEIAFLRAGRKRRKQFFMNTAALLITLAILSGYVGYLVTHPTGLRVTNLYDNGSGSLRWAIENAKSGDEITFDSNLRGSIQLKSANLFIVQNLTILGPPGNAITISMGNNGYRVGVLSGFSVSISNLVFEGDKNPNFVGSPGALISNQGTLVLRNSTVSNNISTTSGGILNSCEHCPQGASLTMIDSKVLDNSSVTGGGINNYDSLSLINSTIAGNINKCGKGGGIYNSGLLTITNSTISGNSASSKVSSVVCGLGEGGGIYNEGTFVLTDSTISNNRATSGGGISSSNGNFNLTNNTISTNRADDDGGGIAVRSSQASITFCTIYHNIAKNDGGGVVNRSDKINRSQVTMSNSIVAENTAYAGSDFMGNLTTYGYNLIQKFTGATFTDPLALHSKDIEGDRFPSLKIDPSLLNNGGLTQTHALLQGSPAIDAIPLNACLLEVNKVANETDQRGMKRPDPDDRNETSTKPLCDIGAYEYQDAPT